MIFSHCLQVLRLRCSRGYAQHERFFQSRRPSPVRPERSAAQSKGSIQATPLKQGDVVELEIEKIGVLRNRVVRR